MAIPFVPLVLAAGLVAVTLRSSLDGEPPTMADLESQLDATALGSSFGSESLMTAETPSRYTVSQSKLEAPYKTFLRMEPTVVSDHYLLAILLAGSTRRSPVEVALELLQHVGGDISMLEQASVWRPVPGVGDSGHARVLAAVELSRRAQYRQAMLQRPVVNTPEDAMNVFRPLVAGPYEKLAAIYVDRKQRIIGSRLLTIGSAGCTIVDPAQILRPAIELGAGGIILAHQHPSGDPIPSATDLAVTKLVAEAAKVLRIRLLDHLVIGAQDRWESIAQRGQLPITLLAGVGVTR